MSQRDYLYQLLPAIYRQKDIEGDGSLLALFRAFEAVHTELEESTQALYENWFIETCSEAFIDQVGSLLGVQTPPHAARRRALVANAAQRRQRRGIHQTIQEVVEDATGWRAEVLLLRERLAMTQHLKVSPRQPSVASLREATPLVASRNASVRASRGGFLPRHLGILLWRLLPFRVLQGSPKEIAAKRYTVHPLGIDAAIESDVNLWETGPGLVPSCVPREALAYADLSSWVPARTSQSSARFLIDVNRGRILDQGESASALLIDYTYKRSAFIGGGAYELKPTPTAEAWLGRVEHRTDDEPGANVYQSLPAAIEAWLHTGMDGVISLASHGLHTMPSTLRLGARSLTIESVHGVCPCVLEGFAAEGEAEASLTLRGLLLSTRLVARGGFHLTIEHCTVCPLTQDEQGALECEEGSLDAAPMLIIRASIVGPMLLSGETRLEIYDSIIDGGQQAAISSPEHVHGARSAKIFYSTIFGAVTVREMTLASHVIFDGPLSIAHTSVGKIRYCYHPGEKVPAPYKCYVGLKHKPRFTSKRYGDPGYAQLSASCPKMPREGGEGNTELGVFHHLQQPSRIEGMRTLLKEQLPIGFEPLFFFVE